MPKDEFLTRGMMKWFWDSYTSRCDPADGDLRLAAAGHDRAAARLPPALVQTAGNDVLRDEGEQYARKMDAAGVDVIADALQRHDPRLGTVEPVGSAAVDTGGDSASGRGIDGTIGGVTRKTEGRRLKAEVRKKIGGQKAAHRSFLPPTC